MKLIKFKEYEWTVKLYHKSEKDLYSKHTWVKTEEWIMWYTHSNYEWHTTYTIVMWDYWNTVPHEILHTITHMFQYLWIEFDQELWAYNVWYYTKEYFKYLQNKEWRYE